MSDFKLMPYASACREYRDAGWLGVLPLPPGQKGPPPEGYTGARGVDPDEETLSVWERTRADGNIALRLPAGVVGIDVDDYGTRGGGATLAQLEAAYGPLPPTWRSSARPGGVSGIRFYRVPQGTHFNGELGPGIDVIQRHHRYAVVAPSTNPAAGGAAYRWYGPDGETSARVPSPEELAELPADWFNLQGQVEGSRAQNTQPVVEVLGGGVLQLDLTQMWAPFELPEIITAGDRNETLFRYACSLVGRGVRDAEALVLLEDAYARCSPPWRDEEPAAMWSRARAAYGRSNEAAAEPGSLEDLLAGEQMRYDVDRAAYRLIVAEKAKARVAELDTDIDAWSGAGWDDLPDETEMPAPRELTYSPGSALMAPGVNCLFGAPASGKSWLAYLAVAQAVQRGPGERALIIDYEMDQRTAMFRLRLLGLSARQIREQVVYVKPPGAFNSAARERIAGSFPGGLSPAVVVVDSVNESLGKHSTKTDYTSSSDVARWGQEFIRELQGLWPNAVLILIDHVKKDTQAPARSPIGSQAKEALLDAMFRVEIMSGAISQTEQGLGRITCLKDRRGWFTKDTDVIEYTFGGGTPFELRPWDPNMVYLDLPDFDDLARRLASFVGANEGVPVEAARKAVQGASGADWTSVKERLIADEVLSQPARKGLRKGPAWASFMAARQPDAGAE